ncbi:MAG: hypothetical protein PHW76_01620 [Alphaproteobacteria bacterium]|nr:hypothetical protein [Alphaproteobacteria bacterium]
MKNLTFGPLILLLALGGCTEAVAVGDLGIIGLTRTREMPPADTSYSIPAQETWCYRTMADTECFAAPQDVPPSRLVNVAPQYYYPMTADGYRARLAGLRPETPAKSGEEGGF